MFTFLAASVAEVEGDSSNPIPLSFKLSFVSSSFLVILPRLLKSNTAFLTKLFFDTIVFLITVFILSSGDFSTAIKVDNLSFESPESSFDLFESL